MSKTYTNSSLGVARSCLRKYDLQFNQKLELAIEGTSEALQVGTAWHKAQHYSALGLDPYAAIVKHAPGQLWAIKLARLFASHQWYWRDQGLRVIEPEAQFKIQITHQNGVDVELEGQIDLKVETANGQRAILEYKTTSDSVEPGSDYWTKLRMDTQCGIYALAGQTPAIIIYDVVRKPTINPKSLGKADIERFKKELGEKGTASYFGEEFSREIIEQAITDKDEGIHLYGARLTADIGDRPSFYFARQEVARTTDDYASLVSNVVDQIRLIEHAQREGLMHRNPNACDQFGLCQFFKLCSNNIRPMPGTVPNGYRVRMHLHPELAPDDYPGRDPRDESIGDSSAPTNP